jgi:hypothetical protein
MVVRNVDDPAMRISSVALLAVVLLMIVGCTTDNQQGNPFQLPSGRVIRVLAMAPLHYTNGNPPSLMFQYQTDLQVSDKEALRTEVDEIWPVLRVDAERGNYKSAIVSAREIPKGIFIKNAKGFNFVYQKSTDGSWRRLGDPSETK